MTDVRGIVGAAGGPELLARLDALDALAPPRSRRPAAPVAAPPRGAACDVDVIVAGGGLWSLLAPLLARRGLTVAVVERGRAGASHREWNASAPELEALVRTGLLDAGELAELVIARYRTGTCAFHGGGSYAVDGVLDCAVDAGGLLALARRKAEALGVRFLDGHAIVAEASGPDRVAIRAEAAAGATTELTARVLVDARGAASPYASADLVCPTVGGVIAGLEEGTGPGQMDPEVGEILATIDPIEDGRQHVWEAFPGKRGETTVYLFYYARADEPVSLVALYARFFAELGAYKRGASRLVRPTFGLIPGWSRLSPAPAPPPGRIVLVGDAAARHSPLTYCGFGATLRSLDGAAGTVAAWIDRPGAVPPHAMADAPIHALTGALAHMLAARSFAGDELNGLLDASFASLHAMGPQAYAALLRDELPPRALVDFLRRTARRHPAVWGQVTRGLGLGRMGRWGAAALRALA